MKRFTTLAFATVLAPATLQAQASAPLTQVQSHLRAVDTMTANFAQTDRRGQTLTGTLEGGAPLVSVTLGAWAAESEVADLLRDVDDYFIRSLEGAKYTRIIP